MFWRLALATCSQLNSVAKIACFAQIGQFLKPFSFSLEHFWLFIVFFVCLSHTHRVSLTNPPFSSSFLLQSSRKRYGFSYSHLTFHDYSFVFLICELLLSFEKYNIRTWVWFILLSEFDWVLMILIVRCLSHRFFCWCLCSELCFMTMLLCASCSS